MYCKNCGASLADNARFCPKCGQHIGNARAEDNLPTTLIELGYMTNADEDLWMASEAGQEQMVTGIVNGVNRYFGIE